MLSTETRYNPSIHGDPEDFIETPVDRIRNLRRTSVLASAFSPLVVEFKNKLEDSFPPEVSPRFLDGIDIERIKYDEKFAERVTPFAAETDILELFSSQYRLISINKRHGEIVSIIPLHPDIEVPIGEYGRRIAIATAKTAGALSIMAGDLMKEEGDALSDTNYHTAIQRDTFLHVPHRSLGEGFQSIGASIGILLSNKIEGIDNPLDAVEYLIKQRVFQHFAARSPGGIIVPMATFGVRFKKPLETGADETIDLSAEVIDLLRREIPYKLNGSGRLGNGCPVAMRNVPILNPAGEPEIIRDSGVQTAMEIFLPYLRYFYNNPRA